MIITVFNNVPIAMNELFKVRITWIVLSGLSLGFWWLLYV